MSELMLRALAAGCGVGMLAGSLGCYVVWRRMSYVGDAMGHASLMGVVLGLLAGISPLIAVLVTAAFVGLVLAQVQKDKRLPFDALLAMVSTGGLSIGLSLFALLPNRQIDLNAYLFGDVLAVSSEQILIIYLLFAVQLALLSKYRVSLLRMVIHEEIARVEGVPVERLQLMMTVLIAVTVAVALQVVGMLLITAMLVIPPMAARLLSRTPYQMIALSTSIGIAAAVIGIIVSYHYNIATGPSIVLSALGLFFSAMIASKIKG